MRLLPLAVLVALAACDSQHPSAAAALSASEWTLVRPGDLGDGVTLVLGPDGTMTGDGPCNAYFGVYTAQSNGVVGPLFSATVQGSTRIWCGDAVGRREAEYHAALMAATQWTVDGDRLTLRARDGRLVFEAR